MKFKIKIDDADIEFTEKEIPKINKMIVEHNKNAITLGNLIKRAKELFITNKLEK